MSTARNRVTVTGFSFFALSDATVPSAVFVVWASATPANRLAAATRPNFFMTDIVDPPVGYVGVQSNGFSALCGWVRPICPEATAAGGGVPSGKKPRSSAGLLVFLWGKT